MELSLMNRQCYVTETVSLTHLTAVRKLNCEGCFSVCDAVCPCCIKTLPRAAITALMEGLKIGRHWY